MGLRGDLAEYFKLLVEAEEPECRRIGVPVERSERARNSLKSRLLARAKIELPTVTDVIFQEDLPRIYAALGTCETGATLALIRTRTGLPSRELQRSIKKLIELGCVRKSGDRYYPLQNHLNLERLKSAPAFRARFRNSATRAQRKIEESFDSAHSLFFVSAFSVRSSDLPALKDELRNVLLRYVDRSEAPEGDRVVEMVASLLE